MVSRTKCNFCGAPIDFSSNKCQFCNQAYDLQKKPILKFEKLFNKRKFSINKSKFKELKTSLKNNFIKKSLFFKKKVLITKIFVQKEFQKKRTKKIIFIYLPISLLLIFSSFIIIKKINQRQIAYKKNEKVKLQNELIESGILKKIYGNLEGAIKDFQTAAEINHPNPIPYKEIGKIKYTQKDYSSAVNNFSKAIDLESGENLINLFFARANAYEFLDLYEEVLQDLKKVVELSEIYGEPNINFLNNSPENNFKLKLYTYLANVNRYLNNYQDSLDYANKVIDIDPNFNEIDKLFIYQISAQMKYALKDYEGSIKDANTALEPSKSDKIGGFDLKQEKINKAYTYYFRGYSNYELKKFKDFCDDINKAVELGGESFQDNSEFFKEKCKKDSIFIEFDKDKEKYYLNKLQKEIYITKKNCSNVLSLSNLLIEVSEGAEGYYFRGRAKAKCLNDSKSSINDLTKAIEMNPLNDDYIYSRGLLFSEFGMHLKAINDFNKAITLNEKEEYFTSRGISKYKLEKYKESISDFSIAILTNKNQSKYAEYFSPRNYLLRSKSRIKLNQYIPALEDVNYVLKEIRPSIRTWPEVYLYRGIIQFKLSDNKSACNSIDIYKRIHDKHRYPRFEIDNAMETMEKENYDSKSSVYAIYKKYCL